MSKLTLISSATASGSASIDFTSGIDSTYDGYVFYYVNIHGSASNASFEFNGSSDGGSNYNVIKTTTQFSAQHNESDSGSALFYDTGRDTAQGTGFQILNFYVDGAAADTSACGDLSLFSPSSTTYVKHFYSTSQYVYYDASSPYSINSYNAGYLNTTSAVNAIRFQMNSGTFDGNIYMFGAS